MAKRLSKIYTRGGDGGETGIAGGTRVSKASTRIHVIGEIDELNAQVGVLRTHTDGDIDAFLAKIQHHLFDLGGDIAMGDKLLFPPEHSERIESMIDRMNSELSDLSEFILPGGGVAAAHSHVVRTVCRRAERSFVALAVAERTNPAALRYLNRLSDYFFVLARYLNHVNGDGDVLWNNPYRR